MKKQNNTANKLIFLHFIQPSVLLDNFEFVHISKIKKIKKNSVSELYLGDALDYLTNDDCQILLKEISSKLIKNGKLHIQSYDSKCLCSALINSTINNAVYKNLLFNSGGKKNIYTLTEMRDLLSSMIGGSISKCQFINGIQYYIEFNND